MVQHPYFCAYTERSTRPYSLENSSEMDRRARRWTEPKNPLVNEWINKMCHVCTTEYYSGFQKQEVLSFVTARKNKDMVSEISQVHKDRMPYEYISSWNLRDACRAASKTG